MSIDAAWRTALPPVVSLLMFFGAEPLTAVREETAKPTEGWPLQDLPITAISLQQYKNI